MLTFIHGCDSCMHVHVSAGESAPCSDGIGHCPHMLPVPILTCDNEAVYVQGIRSFELAKNNDGCQSDSLHPTYGLH